MKQPSLANIRRDMRAHLTPKEAPVLKRLIKQAGLSDEKRSAIGKRAENLVSDIRNSATPGIMEVFLAEYGLSTDEGIALMCLAEALLRVPDADTIDALIEDKIAPSDWGKHLGHSSSSLVNASTWALLLTGKVLEDQNPGLVGTLRAAVKRLGEPVIRTAVGRAMREMGRQFVLGQTIDEALKNGKDNETMGFTHSYDMLGEAARTEADAKAYHLAYSHAISALAKACVHDDIRRNPGISVKLSALHPRYEMSKKARLMDELVPRVHALALLAKSAGMGFNIDAEEADRLDLSLDIIEAVLSDPSLADWDGFGVVVQAYGPRASYVLDWLHALAEKHDRRIMVRLVKGAYWDTEIKLAQTLGTDGFPVFSRKASTDVSYIANAQKLLGMTDHIYPQFATHNAHTVAAVLEMATDPESYEFQRLHGMGESLHDIVIKQEKTRCRIYAPVGAHRDLLAYLVRRLLENGANSSFVNQIVDLDVPASEVASDPFEEVLGFLPNAHNPAIALPKDLYGKGRKNALGWDLTDPHDIADIEKARAPFQKQKFKAQPIIAGKSKAGEIRQVINPFNPNDQVGQVIESRDGDIETALSAAKPWCESAKQRAKTLNKAADLYEENYGLFFALASREAGKTQLDAVGELREAVDFLRYYAKQSLSLNTPARGVFACISPWNFPLAIFTGQLSAALAAGNGVIVKPAETTTLIAAKAVELLHQAGVPATALQMLPGKGSHVGAALSSDPRINGLCFTGSNPTAQRVNRAMADNLAPGAPLIAETGGLNAMIVDSTALPEQAVRDILASAFQSAGQRCSALRMLYVQSDIRDSLLKMLTGAMDDLKMGDPWHLPTDVGPVIDGPAQNKILSHIEIARAEGRVIKQLTPPDEGLFVPPTIISVTGIGDLKEEIFGPVLHIASFEASQIDQVVNDINATGYGLTFGLHTRIDDRVQQIVDQLKVGNTYVNRNQIGAIVGSQPFGGEGLSGTGPKAGGPEYLHRFTQTECPIVAAKTGKQVQIGEIEEKLAALPAVSTLPLATHDLPGPTGESNRLTSVPRGVVLCLGPDIASANQQAKEAQASGCTTLRICPGGDLDGHVNPGDLAELAGFDVVTYWGETETAQELRSTLAKREGRLLPLVTSKGDHSWYRLERHICIDTTASGGNAALLAGLDG